LGHQSRLGGRLAIVDKRRASADVTRQENIIGGPVEGRVALLFDDMISTAGSICGAARVVMSRGAKKVIVAATHGVLAGKAVQKLAEAPIDKVILTDSIPLSPEKTIPKIEMLSVAPLLGEAIKRIHRNESVSRLFDSDEPR
jgi:ribose-phosphate pyrophosphokinase